MSVSDPTGTDLDSSVRVRVDVWSDVICPWCYLGKRRLEAALRDLPYADVVDVHWHSFLLDPTHPRGVRQPVPQMLAAKFGAAPEQVRVMTQRVTELAAAEGLTYALDRAIMVNTVDAHRVTQLAARHGLDGAMHERLLRAHLIEAEVLDDPQTLTRLAVEVGLAADEVRRLLAGDRYAAEVAADVRAARQRGATGVPFFVVADRWGISGAQPVEVFTATLRAAHTAATG
ncbi:MULTISPECIES: DsbA family oxidoreductase [unclassified Solwaraspora]|uniref:DsbA family oxidoreductase n=1 Tax=unclassified Solwaraspora TaxID=2627926 RepID=UPI00259BDDC4|nr:DsbA family oxidoreductase [Solwaraspora sp. WMMA2056]WJK42652.1 DsbA family oxidoreductase [Solwaraspora sp. WMMA2056]